MQTQNTEHRTKHIISIAKKIETNNVQYQWWAELSSLIPNTEWPAHILCKTCHFVIWESIEKGLDPIQEIMDSSTKQSNSLKPKQIIIYNWNWKFVSNHHNSRVIGNSCLIHIKKWHWTQDNAQIFIDIDNLCWILEL